MMIDPLLISDAAQRRLGVVRLATQRAMAPRAIRPLARLPLHLALVSALALPVTAVCAESRADESETLPVAAPLAPATDLDGVVVVGRRENLVGEAVSASEGVVGQEEISVQPILRSGDLLEFVPGLVSTQHSGSGKANQYFLRGFNLDHGTDFATFVDGMPVNMRTHGHGQGYTDLNFLIPEAVEELSYRKGVNYADVGDFSSAGSARFRIASHVQRGLAEVTTGADNYLRGVLLDAIGSAERSFLYGVELQRNDGAWTDIDEDLDKTNVLLKYSGEVAGGRGAITFLGYENSWNSPDQIPARAIAQGLVDELGSIDTTLGGNSTRYSLSADWSGRLFGGVSSASVYALTYKMNLYSNFTYFLDDPDNGDQFRQRDDRNVYGFAVSQQWDRGRSRWRAGAEGRFDDIDHVGLYRTVARAPISTIRDDAVEESSLGVYLANEYRVNEQLRTYVGLRYDRYHFDVNARSLPVNSGSASDGTTSLKGSVIYKPSAHVELYASAGEGFHSNDARGTTISVDPASGEPADPVDPLVDSTGYELGTRVFLSERLHATAAIWRLDLDSELLFVGDAGTTEVSRPSRRDGIELGLYWFGSSHFYGDIEASYTNARFTDPGDDEIPGAVPFVLSSSVTARVNGGMLDGAFSTLQLRHVGRYPLIESGSVESDGSTIVNLRFGKDWDAFGLHLDVFNLFDSNDHDIEYFYASRLPGEPADGLEDIHHHSFEPRSVRLSLRYRF